MGIIKELLKEIGTSELTEDMRKICDMIEKEECKEVGSYIGPDGPNVFLSLEISKVKDKGGWFIHNFITLEREVVDEYLVRQWTRRSKLIPADSLPPLKLIESWPIRKSGKAESILKEFIIILQHLKGE